MKNIHILFLLSVVLWSSCTLSTSAKLDKIQKISKVTPSVFKETIPVESSEEGLIVKVKIRNKFYNFLLSTNYHYSVMSKELSKSLKLETIAKSKYVDENCKTKDLSYVNLNHVGIGKLDFSDIVFVDGNFKSYNEENCISIQGIIGTNLLAKAIWQIDYFNHKITVSDKKQSLDFSADKKTIPFNLESDNGIGTPVVQLRYKGNYLCDAYLNTSSSGSVSFPKTLIKTFADTLPQLTESFLNTSKKIVETKAVKISGLNIDEKLSLYPFWVWEQEENSSAMIGNVVLKDFIVTLDWKAQEVTFSSQKPLSECKTPGYSTNYKMIVDGLIKNSPADKAGLMLGDKIINFDGKDLRGITKEQFCEWTKNLQEMDRLKLKVQRDDKIFDVELDFVFYNTLFK